MNINININDLLSSKSRSTYKKTNLQAEFNETEARKRYSQN